MSRLRDSALKIILLAVASSSPGHLSSSGIKGVLNTISSDSSTRSYSYRHLQNTFYQARKAGLIDIDSRKQPFLTGRGQSMVDLYQPQKLENSQLMVIFDIPEQLASKRRSLRRTLQDLKFRQIQLSVWVTEYDCKDYLTSELAWLGIGEYVQMYEAVRI